MSMKLNRDWPLLTHYDADHLRRTALPLGGIGTGTVSVGGRGELRDWELFNRPAKGFSPSQCFFALYAKPSGGEAVTRVLEGAIDPVDYNGSHDASANDAGLPRFRECSFHAAYPFGQWLLHDRDVPVDVRIEAFNPFVPTDADASGMPVAVLRYVLRNRTSRNVQASVCGSLRNIVGAERTRNVWDHWRIPNDNRNRPRRSSRPKARGLLMTGPNVDEKSEAFGTMALATTASGKVTMREAWADIGWRGDLLDFWDDFSANGKLTPRKSPGDAGALRTSGVTGSVAAPVNLPPRGEKTVTFLITWHLPNRRSWTPRAGSEKNCPEYEIVGNYYTEQYRDAWDAAIMVADRFKNLERDTVKFVNALCETDAPRSIREAALYNASTLRSPTTFRLPSGHLMGWEGCHSGAGCCHGSCTHVWNYEHTTAMLFGDLAWTMREVELAYNTDDHGLMGFRAMLPLGRPVAAMAAADGQMGCVMKLYREWRLSGDDEALRRLWPAARRALEFAWRPGGWDPDRDGVMEGCQHNTMDVEYFGPNPEIGVWYLGALRAAEKMASHLGEDEFADTCHELYESGRQYFDGSLFNGEYYEHEIRLPARGGKISKGLQLGMGDDSRRNPRWQVGPGCQTDQLVGQLMAHVCGLGYLLKPTHVRKALRSIMKHNWRGELYGHFNHARSYALNEEAGLIVCTWPRGGRPEHPFPYAMEVWPGLEYTAAGHMLYEGQDRPAVKIVDAVRDRFDGAKRNPFNEPECGWHYARSMAAWATLLGYTGFQYSASDKSIAFRAANEPATWFWSTGHAWGTVRQKPGKQSTTVTFDVLHGKLTLKRLEITGVGDRTFGRRRVVRPGKSLRMKIGQ